jgi:hypothetical protein
MRDIKIEEIADRVAEQYFLPKVVVRKLVKHMFNYIFKVMTSGKDRILMFKSELPQIYTDYDAKRMCHEMIDGKRPSYDRFFKGHRIKPIHRKHLRRPKWNLLEH